MHSDPIRGFIPYVTEQSPRGERTMDILAGQASDVEIHAKELTMTKRRLNEILAANTGQPYDRIERDTDRDYIMGPEEAIEYGLVDRVVSRPREGGSL